MWKFKPFTHKEQTGLEGRTMDIGNLKVLIIKAIAEGGFSCVYLAREALHGTKQYALKHIICNDEESLELVTKEIYVLKSLRGHPNVVSLCADAVFDMGRNKEAFLVMEYCEKSLVSVLESRGAGYFEEKQVLAIFRDVCNAVFVMHCQSPPIAHRDLKAENLLVGPDGIWKLCDFGSTSTNHKRFERPEEMGIEEDNIRKHTTPAYRAPEMWDLFRRELINEKVDIWALGCLLFRICYFKSAFDGESKLQILNGNYRIPDLPKYSSSITDLIKDMLQSSPDARPDVTQVWFRVNDLLPDGLQKPLPDGPPEMRQAGSDMHEGISKPTNKSHPPPRRSPPPPPSTKAFRNASPPMKNSRGSGEGGAMGAFWSTQHANSSFIAEEEKTGPKYDEEPSGNNTKVDNFHHRPVSKNTHEKPSKDFEINFFPDTPTRVIVKPKTSKQDQNETFNTFVAEFDSNKISPGGEISKVVKKEEVDDEVAELKEQLKQANEEKAEILIKYEKLSAICRSQRQEIQDLKHALSSRTPSPRRQAASVDERTPGTQPPITTPGKGKTEGTVWELQQGIFENNSPSLEPKQWQPFAEDPKTQTPLTTVGSKSVRTRNGNKQATNTWGFETDSFVAGPTATSQMLRSSNEFNSSQRFTETKSIESKSVAAKPAGWAGF